MNRIGMRPPPVSRRSTPAQGDKTPVLHQGSRGPAVRRLETELKEAGLLHGKVDRFFGPKTKAAAERLEQLMGWKVNGVVGNRMWGKLLRTDGALTGSGGASPGGSAAPGAGSTSFTTVNINIKNNPLMPQRKVVHDVKRAARQGDLIGWNEIGPARYRKAIRDLGPNWGHYFPKDGGLTIPNPISWKKSVWKKVDAGFMQTHGGEAKVSPNRYITWVKLKNKETGQTIVRMNTHLVSGAWSSPKPTTAWRRKMWNIHMMKLGNLVDRFKSKGLPVIVGGDFNRDSYKVLGNKVAYDNKLNVGTHGRSTLDYVMHVRDDELEKRRAEVQGGYASDHDAVVVKYQLKK